MVKYKKYQFWRCVKQVQGFTIDHDYKIQAASTNGIDGVVQSDDGRLVNLKQYNSKFVLAQEALDLNDLAFKYGIRDQRHNYVYPGKFGNGIWSKHKTDTVEDMNIFIIMGLLRREELEEEEIPF